jgi:hypothetical protein
MPADQAGVAVLPLGLGSTGAWAQPAAKRNGERFAARRLQEVPGARAVVPAH